MTEMRHEYDKLINTHCIVKSKYRYLEIFILKGESDGFRERTKFQCNKRMDLVKSIRR